MGWSANSGTPARRGPGRHAAGHYQIGGPGHEPGPNRDEDDRRRGRGGRPDGRATERLGPARLDDDGSTRCGRASPGRPPPTRRAASPATSCSPAATAVPGARTTATAPTRRHAIVLVGLETSYRFRLRAVDAAGHWSPWTLGPVAFAPHAVDDRAPPSAGRRAGRRRTRWPRTEDRDGLVQRGASLTMTFTGHGIAVVAPQEPDRGSAKVYIDGVYIRTIFLWSRTTPVARPSSPPGSRAAARHRITLRVVGGGRPPAVPARCVRRLEVVACNGPSLRGCAIVTVPTSPGRESPGRPAERRGRPWRVRCGRGPSSSDWSPSRSSSISRPSPRASASTCSTRRTCRASR